MKKSISPVKGERARRGQTKELTGRGQIVRTQYRFFSITKPIQRGGKVKRKRKKK